ncbi:MAG: hypothetical protein JW763_06910 [candidate division Zixibacteria bacterium]|nr:hypothetical protein [candidate division Zixibacteria bacterium]
MKRLLVLSFLLVCSPVVLADSADTVAIRPHFRYISPTAQFIPEVEKAITDARSTLTEILQDSLAFVPDIYIVNNLARFRELVGSVFPDWGAAAALPYRNVIVIKSPAHFNLGKSLTELVKHEYAHLALAHRLGAARAPRWLDEGVAMYTSAEWGWQQNLSMSRAMIFRGTVPLYEIERLNSFPEGQAQTAYAESYLAVKYLLDMYEVESFIVLLDQLREHQSLDAALEMATGAGYREFDREFFNYLAKRYNWVSVFVDTYFLWIFLAIVVFIGFMLQYRRRRKYYRKWEEEEKYQSTDFDYGDPDNPEQVDDEDKPWM